jgi:NADH:ubiquinone oxidoreductase subunit 3 (subunit A)
LLPIIRNQAKIKGCLIYTYYISGIAKITAMGASSLIVLVFAAIAFSAGGIAIAKIFVKGSKNPQKGQTYESGIKSEGSPWNQFNVGYYLFALIFLIFDVELIFMYPWAVVVKKIGMPALIEIVVFLFILFMGFLYAHKKGALKWV